MKPLNLAEAAGSRADRDRVLAQERLREMLALRQEAALERVGGAWTDDPECFARAIKSRKFVAVADRYELDTGGLLLTGPTGAGKTSAIRRALRRLIRASRDWRDPILRAHWATALELAGARRRHELGAGEAREVDFAMRAPVLVLDELGFEVMHDTTILEILDARYVAGLPTLVTAGRKIAELRERYGAAAIRRVHEPVGAVVEDWPCG